MRYLLLFVSLLFSTFGLCGQFMPPNNLDQEDCINCFNSNGMTEDLFNRIVDAGRVAYAENAQNNSEKLVINNLWSDSTVNANCCRGCTYGQVTVNMYGGMARRAEINPEGFALVLGHELSHAYGGEPYYPNSDRMSAEGQSDYEGARTAYRKIAALVPELNIDFEPSEYIKNQCNGDKQCEHSLVGGLALGTLLARLSGNVQPSYETPDTSVVWRTETSYPKTTQCRLDTYRAGTLNLERPSCWFKKPGIDEPNDPWQWPWDWPTWPWLY